MSLSLSNTCERSKAHDFSRMNRHNCAIAFCIAEHMVASGRSDKKKTALSQDGDQLFRGDAGKLRSHTVTSMDVRLMRSDDGIGSFSVRHVFDKKPHYVARRFATTSS